MCSAMKSFQCQLLLCSSFYHFPFFEHLRCCRSPWRQPGGENVNSPRAFTGSCDRRPGGHAGAYQSAANPSLHQHPGSWLSRTDPVSISLNMIIILNTTQTLVALFLVVL